MSFTGREFDNLSSAQQFQACLRSRLFARVEPAHKSKIVEYLQTNGDVTAMVSEKCKVSKRIKANRITFLLFVCPNIMWRKFVRYIFSYFKYTNKRQDFSNYAPWQCFQFAFQYLDMFSGKKMIEMYTYRKKCLYYRHILKLFVKFKFGKSAWLISTGISFAAPIT